MQQLFLTWKLVLMIFTFLCIAPHVTTALPISGSIYAHRETGDVAYAILPRNYHVRDDFMGDFYASVTFSEDFFAPNKRQYHDVILALQ